MPNRNFMSAREHGYDLERADLINHIVLSEHDDTLQGEAELAGLLRELSQRFPPSLFNVVYHGRGKLLLSESATNEILAYQDDMLDYMEREGLLEADDYFNILAPAIAAFWAGLEINERITYCQHYEWPMYFALETNPPDDAMSELEEIVSQ